MSAYESVDPSSVVAVVLVRYDAAPGCQYHYGQYQCAAEEQVMAWLGAAQLPAEVYLVCMQEAVSDDLLAYLRLLESPENFAEVSIHLELERQC